MSFQITCHEELALVISTFKADFAFEIDLLAYVSAQQQAFAALEEPVYHVLDVRELELIFHNIQAFVSAGTGNQQAALLHPKILQPIIVTHNPLFAMIVRSLREKSYDHIPTLVYDDLEDAIAYVRACTS